MFKDLCPVSVLPEDNDDSGDSDQWRLALPHVDVEVKDCWSFGSLNYKQKNITIFKAFWSNENSFKEFWEISSFALLLSKYETTVSILLSLV